MKSAGIIGGLGPETSSEFYLEVIFKCQERDDTQRPLIVMSSVPLPFNIEKDLIATNTGIERYVPYLTAEARRLEKAGVDFIVMPCNSLHVFIEDIRKAVNVPVLSIVEETVVYLKKMNFKNVGLISTSSTIANNVYESKLDEAGFLFKTPNDFQKAKMDKIIQRLIKGRHLNSDREMVLEVVELLSKNGVDCVALACTDLQLLLPSSTEVPIFDTMRVLAMSTVDMLLS